MEIFLRTFCTWCRKSRRRRECWWQILGQWGLIWVHESALPVATNNPKILVDNGKKLLSFDDRSSGQPRFGSVLLFVFFFFLIRGESLDFFFFILIRDWLLYNIVLVFPYINMNLPQVYTCSPSWTGLPPPSLYHPSGSSQCTSPKHPVSCIEPGLAIHFLYDIIHVSMPFSKSIPPSQSPKDCSIHLCLFCCLAYRVIVTIFLNSIYMY